MLGQLRIDSGIWDVGLTYIPIEDSSILLRLQQSNPIFHMGVEVMSLPNNVESQYRVTPLTREDLTKTTGAPTAVKGLVWFTDGSRKRGGKGLESMGNR